MSFNYVAINDGCVAGLQFIGDLVEFLVGNEVIGFFYRNLIIIVLDVFNPSTTATSGGG